MAREASNLECLAASLASTLQMLTAYPQPVVKMFPDIVQGFLEEKIAPAENFPRETLKSLLLLQDQYMEHPAITVASCCAPLLPRL